MPETAEPIAPQKIISFVKGGKVKSVYTTAYSSQQAWDFYLDCYKRHGANTAAKVEDTPEVPPELAKAAWEQLQEEEKDNLKPKKDKDQ